MIKTQGSKQKIQAAIETPYDNSVSGLTADDVKAAIDELHSWSQSYFNFFNGTFLESFNALVTSNGTTITLSLEQNGGGDLTMNFSDGRTTLDCTPAQTVTLTAGSIAIPQENFTYIPQSTKVLTNSTTGWPSEEHIKVTYTFCQTAAYVQSDGALINQNWNDHTTGTDDQGHLTHVTERSRRLGAIYYSGVDGAGTDDYTTSTAGVVTVQWGAGVLYQMHKHTVPALDTSAGDDLHVVNAHSTDGGAYFETTNLYDITVDSTGSTLTNKYFNLVLWGVANKGGEYAPAMVNIPSGSYNNLTDAQNDTDGYDVYDVPRQFTKESSTGFLVARLTFRKTGGTFEYHSTIDLRGQTPTTVTGGGTGGSIVEFADNQFKVYDGADNTKVMIFTVDAITTANTRTVTMPDADVNLGDIATNTSNISTNTSNISTNTSNISTNTTNISTNTSNIATKLTDPMTTRGDVMIRDATNTTARLAIGAANQVLTSDGTDVSWAAAAGGGFDPDVEELAIGLNAAASGDNGTSIGFNTDAIGARSSALGYASQAGADESIAIGDGANASAGKAIAIGDAAQASQIGNVALGALSIASGNNVAIAIGYSADATAQHSIAMSYTALASSNWAVAIGSYTVASGSGSVALGYHADATFSSAAAIGPLAQATAIHALGLGSTTNASSDYACCIGWTATATANYATAIGPATDATGLKATAIGVSAQATSQESIAIGDVATAQTSTGAIAIGDASLSSGLHSVALGSSTDATASHSTAIGFGAQATHADSTALGDSAATTAINSVAIGGTGNKFTEFIGTVFVKEQASAEADKTGYGQIWVRSSDGALMFTNASGTDYTIDVTAV